MGLPVSTLAPLAAPNAIAFRPARRFVVSGDVKRKGPFGLDGPAPTLTLPVVGAVNVAVAVLVAVLVLFAVAGGAT